MEKVMERPSATFLIVASPTGSSRWSVFILLQDVLQAYIGADSTIDGPLEAVRVARSDPDDLQGLLSACGTSSEWGRCTADLISVRHPIVVFVMMICPTARLGVA